MKTKKKALTLALCAVLLVGATFLGTLAYLTDDDAVTNTFTVGKVEIDLKERVPGTENLTDVGNEYHLLPGLTYDKEPIVTVKGGSEDCYVRILMTVHNASAVQKIIDADNAKEDEVKDYAQLFGCDNPETGKVGAGWNVDKWSYNGFKLGEGDANTITFEFRYNGIVEGPESDKALEALFTDLIVPGYVTNEQLAELYGNATSKLAKDGAFKIDLVAHAIQSAGFADADAAWGAWTN